MPHNRSDVPSGTSGAPTVVPQGRRPSRRPLTRDDWIEAGIAAIQRYGLRGAAVEPLAEDLGATKGSFYWHFRDRNALLQAIADSWEYTHTEQRIKQLDRIADPWERYQEAVAWLRDDASEGGMLALMLWNSDSPQLRPALDRVMRKRLDFSLRLRAELGLTEPDAGLHVVLSYATWLGLYLLRRGAPELVEAAGPPEALTDYVTRLLDPRGVQAHQHDAVD
jgi:AcrR family transcriptional regulator